MRRLLRFLLLLLWMGIYLSPAAAQSYSFQLIEEIVHAYWNADGSLSLDYTFHFANDPGAHPIDFVDVGLPNDRYDFGSISAWVNGQPVRVTRDYQGQGYGVAVDLGAHAIPPGGEGRVRVYVGRITRVLHPSDLEGYVSAVFSPTWFGAAYVHGSTRLQVVFHFPPGVTLQEPRYHQDQGGQPEVGQDSEGRTTYTWSYADARGSEQYFFGASFPARYVPTSAYQPSLWETLWGSVKGLFEALFAWGFILFWCLLVPILVVIGLIGEFRRKSEYLPPLVKVEGHGIKRGLTAVEAALLLEQPLDKVMTMILFSVIKKGAAEVISPEPLQIQVLQPLPEGLQVYEQQFLQAMQEKTLAARRKMLRQMIVDLIASLREKMRGFSRKETVEYYRSIVRRAWEQVEAAQTPEVKGQLFGEALEWMMLDENYDDRTRRVFHGPVYVPQWWHRYDPTYRPAPATASSGSGRSGPLPGSTFAASVIRSVQSVASNVLGNTRDFTEGVTRITNPPPPPSVSHRGGGGGCACACAGCACACAGGGR